MTILPLLLALCSEPSPAATPTGPVPIPPHAERHAAATNAPPPIKLQSAPPPLPPAPKRKLVYILPDLYAVQTSPGVIYLCIPEHNFRDLAKLFPTNTTHLEGVQVWREEP